MLAEAILSKTKVLTQHQSLRQIGILLSGNAGAYVIALLSQPILSRLYSPSQFGEFAFLNSILAILLIGASGKYEAGIVLTRKPQHAKRLFQLSQALLITYVSIIFLALTIAPQEVMLWFAEQGISTASLWFIPLLIFSAGYWEIVRNWLIRLRNFSKISITLILQRLLIFAGSVLAFAFPIVENGLVFGLITGSAGLLIISLLLHKESLHLPVRGIRTYANHFREFPFFSVPSLFILSSTQHLPVFWLSYFCEQSITGLFSIAFTIVMLPFALLNMSTFPVYYERLSQSTSAEKVKTIYKYFTLFTVVLFPFTLLIFFYGESVTVFAFGKEWEKAGYIASLLSPVGFFHGLASCFIIPLTVLRKQSLSLLFQFLRFSFWGFALFAGFLFDDIYLTFKIVSFLSLLHFAILTATVYPLIKNLSSQKD